MPYPKHFRVQFGGQFCGSEVWATGLHMSDGLLADDFARKNFASAHVLDVANAVKTWFTSTGSHVSKDCSLDFVKFNAIGADGKYMDDTSDNTIVYTTGTTLAGTGTQALPTGNRYPPQIALVVTLTSARKRGPGSHGRLFLPVQPMTLTNGRIAQSSLTPIANAFAGLIRDLNDWPGLDLGTGPKVSLVSPNGPGYVEPVTGVKIGDLLDTVTRRRNRLKEAYGATAV